MVSAMRGHFLTFLDYEQNRGKNKTNLRNNAFFFFNIRLFVVIWLKINVET